MRTEVSSCQPPALDSVWEPRLRSRVVSKASLAPGASEDKQISWTRSVLSARLLRRYLACVKRVRKGAKPFYDIQYKDFVDEDGNPENETGVTEDRLRPPLAQWLQLQQVQVLLMFTTRVWLALALFNTARIAAQCPPLSAYKRFDSVEILYKDGWCVTRRGAYCKHAPRALPTCAWPRPP